MTCIVTFSARTSSGAVRPNAKLIFEAAAPSIRAAGSGIVPRDVTEATANSDGEGDVLLHPGSYILRMITELGIQSAELSVPDAATVDLWQLLEVASGTPVTPASVLAAQGAATAAAGSASASGDSATAAAASAAATAALINVGLFTSKPLAQTMALAGLGVPVVRVIEAGEVLYYVPIAGATDLIGADGSTWRRASVGVANLIDLAGDLSALFQSVLQDEGSWQPALEWSGGGGAMVYGARGGRWLRLGNTVTVECFATATLTTLGSGNLRLSGMAAGLTPVAGDFPGYLSIKAKNDAFVLPTFASELDVQWTGGSPFGVFSYFSGSGYLSQFVTAITGAPVGNGAEASWAAGAGRGKIIGFENLGSSTGRINLTEQTGPLPSGLVTGTGWTAQGPVTPGTAIFRGAPPGQQFLQAADFAAGRQIFFRAAGSWRVT